MSTDVKEEPPSEGNNDEEDDDVEVVLEREAAEGEEEGELVLLEYEQNLMVDTMEDDVLFITGRGMGLERLFLNHLILYSDQKLLVLVLNTSSQDETFFLNALRSVAKGVDTQPKLINADVPTKDRESIYLEGGVQFITSRILMVDLLTGRVPVEHVAGILVYRAHQVLTSFQESFILRMFREKKRNGFIKAFTDLPTTCSSLGELQRLVSRLYVRRVRILPRFDVDVKKTFEKTPVNVVELDVGLPPLLRRCHTTLTELIKVCGRELKATVGGGRKKRAEDEETAEESMAGIAYLPTPLEREIAEKRSFASDKQKRLLADLSQLRELLKIAEDIDACTLFCRLCAIRSEKESADDVPAWLLSSLASRLFADAETLAGTKQAPFTPPPKWAVYANLLEEIRDHPLPGKDGNGACCGKAAVLVFTSDDVLARQLSDLTRNGPQKLAQIVRRQVPLAARLKEVPPAPLWPVDDVNTFLRNQEEQVDVVRALQAGQKTAARATKRKRQVAEGIMSSMDGKVQTKILQFGILKKNEKRARKIVLDGPSTSRGGGMNATKEETVDEEGEAAAPRLIKDTSVPLVITPHGQRYNMIRQLEALQPSHVIMYNNDLVTLRQIEVYHAVNSERPLHVYCLQYHNSSEEERYLSFLSREQNAFESLTREMQTLLVPREFDVTREAPPKVRLASSRIGGSIAEEEDDSERPKIIVDMREFASELPTVLYKKGYEVVAATLEVGDYVLTPDTVVERKALDDLTQSLQSGRVFKQTEQMLRHYKTVVLLIESGVKFDSRIVNGGPFQGELSRHCRDIRMQLCLLVRRFPQLRLIWAADPDNSAEFFTELKMNKPEPDVAIAVSLHGDDAVNASVDQEGDPSGSRPPNKAKKENAVLFRVLREALPFLGSGDVKKLMLSEKVKCMADLFTADRETLVEILGETNADKLDLLTCFDFGSGE